MAENESNETERRRPDPLALVAGVGTLLVSAYVLTDGASWLPVFDARWLLAGGALLVGLLLLGVSVRKRSR